MEEVKDAGKVHVITFDGYKIACFVGSKDVDKALEIIQNEKLDAAILSSKSTRKDFKYVLHFVTHKTTVNVKRLAYLLVEEGKTNGLYIENNMLASEKSARVFAANEKLIK